ncbi:MAG: InlB B-repeat-containing protein [Paludibacteraceae bacterium]
MKKFTLVLIACFMAVFSYAAGGDITYELNGGVTNAHGWTNKNDMYLGLNTFWNNFKGTSAVWTSLDDLNGNVAAGIPTQASAMDLSFITDPTVAAEWQWLVDYMDAVSAEQGKTLPSTSASYLRYSLMAFFLNSVRATWPASADYAIAGQVEAFMPTWKHGFAGPASYDGSVEVAIPVPYKEGFTFDGWYAESDFSGTKVTAIPVGAEGNKTLYAKWIEYIPPIADIWALNSNGVATKASGVVSLIVGNNVYMQDATAGMMVSFTSMPDVAVGDQIVLSAYTAPNGSLVKLISATLESKETAQIPAIQNINIVAINADVAKEYKTYMYEWVQLLGLIVHSYDGSGNVVLADDAGNTLSLIPKLSQGAYPIGTKLDIKGVVDYNTSVKLNTTLANIKKSPVPQPDPFAYPAMNDGKYSLTSKWMISANLDNLGANPIGTPQFVRGMAAKDGKMYFVDRELKQLTVVDGATGVRLSPIKLASNIFTYENSENEVVTAGALPFNDIKLDAVGHVLLGNCITSNKGMFQIWNIDLATGNGTLVLQEILFENPEFEEASIRFDAFGVYGDVTGDAVILASNASAMEIYKWTITGGVAGQAELIILDTSIEGTYLTGLANPGTAPQVFPLDENLFYLDGNATLPTLIDQDGNILDGFYNNVFAQKDTLTNPGNSWTINQGHNGLIEFEMGGEDFFLIAGTNTAGVPPSTFRLYKWKDANKLFSEMEILWTFPAVGMGNVSNPYRTAVPSVEVDEAAGVAKMYIYTGENGYGMYEFKATTTGLNDQYHNDAVKLFVNDNKIIFDNEVANVSVYSIAGQLITNKDNVSSIEIGTSGIFILKATTRDGKTAVRKVIIK